MPPVPCLACGNKMSSEAAVCPHCGARAAGAPAQLADVQLSGAELRALIAIDEASRGGEHEPHGLFQIAVLPHPRTHGFARVAELALTIAAAPLILCGLLPLAFARRIARNRARDVSGEGVAALTISVSGAFGLVPTLLEAGASLGTTLLVCGAEIALVLVRAGVRASASAGRELMRVARPAGDE